MNNLNKNGKNGNDGIKELINKYDPKTGKKLDESGNKIPDGKQDNEIKTPTSKTPTSKEESDPYHLNKSSKAKIAMASTALALTIAFSGAVFAQDTPKQERMEHHQQNTHQRYAQRYEDRDEHRNFWRSGDHDSYRDGRWFTGTRIVIAPAYSSNCAELPVNAPIGGGEYVRSMVMCETADGANYECAKVVCN